MSVLNLAQPIRSMAFIVTVTLSAILLGSMVWLPMQATPLILPTLQMSSTTSVMPPPTVSANLFGQAPVAAVKTTQSVQETKLRLTLKGVLPSTDPNNSKAIISIRGGNDDLFQVGDEVSSGVQLDEVFQDRVILSRAGVKEVLYFEKPTIETLIEQGIEVADVSDSAGSAVLPGSARQTYQALSGVNQSARVVNSGHPLIRDINTLSVSQLIDTYEKKLQDDPQGLLSSAGLKSTGSSYQVLSSSPLTGIGLRTGDEIVSVNGQAVGVIENDQGLANVLRSQGVARIEMRRGDRRFFVNYPLN